MKYAENAINYWRERIETFRTSPHPQPKWATTPELKSRWEEAVTYHRNEIAHVWQQTVELMQKTYDQWKKSSDPQVKNMLAVSFQKIVNTLDEQIKNAIKTIEED